MRYSAILTAEFPDGIEDPYSVLEDIGFFKTYASEDGRFCVGLPQNTFVGSFEGTSAVEVRDRLMSKVQYELNVLYNFVNVPVFMLVAGDDRASAFGNCR